MLSRFWLKSLLLLAILPIAVLAREDVTIVRVFTGWRDAASFKRISEYFNGRENTGPETVIRTHPGERAGYYFQLRLKQSGSASAQVRFQLTLILENSSAPRTFAFPAELKPGTNLFQLGLTGPDWPDSRLSPVAWHLEVFSDSGQVLAGEKSYLWETPAR